MADCALFFCFFVYVCLVGFVGVIVFLLLLGCCGFFSPETQETELMGKILLTKKL